MIPLFPLTKKLELSDQEEIEGLGRAFPPYSDYNFVSMWSYDTHHLVELSRLNGNLVLKFQDYVDLEMFYTFLGTNQVEQTIEALLLESEKQGIKPFLKLIPESSIESLKNSVAYQIQEDRDNFDYIIDAKEFASMNAPEFHSKRKRVRQFIERYEGHYSTESLSLFDKKIQEEMIALFHHWAEVSGKSKEETEHEGHAIEKLFAGIQQYPLHAKGVRMDGKLQAFIISQIIHDQYAILHFGKWDRSFQGITEFIYQEITKELIKHGCLRLNFEQDLGIEGLRTAKMLCNPIGFLKKYTVRLA